VLLFAVWLVNLVLFALYFFVSVDTYSNVTMIFIFVTQVITLVEVAAFLFSSVRNVFKPKEKPSAVLHRISLQADEVMLSQIAQLSELSEELIDDRVPLRYADY
jgi:hypothetical protein